MKRIFLAATFAVASYLPFGHAQAQPACTLFSVDGVVTLCEYAIPETFAAYAACSAQPGHFVTLLSPQGVVPGQVYCAVVV